MWRRGYGMLRPKTRKEVGAMSIGERITQKRKELGLSQEALGEKLCVSRQAI